MAQAAMALAPEQLRAAARSHEHFSMARGLLNRQRRQAVALAQKSATGSFSGLVNVRGAARNFPMFSNPTSLSEFRWLAVAPGSGTGTNVGDRQLQPVNVHAAHLFFFVVNTSSLCLLIFASHRHSFPTAQRNTSSSSGQGLQGGSSKTRAAAVPHGLDCSAHAERSHLCRCPSLPSSPSRCQEAPVDPGPHYLTPACV